MLIGVSSLLFLVIICFYAWLLLGFVFLSTDRFAYGEYVTLGREQTKGDSANPEHAVSELCLGLISTLHSPAR